MFFADTGFPSAMLALHSSHKCNSSAVTDPSDQLGEEEFMSNIKLRSISEYVYHVYAAALPPGVVHLAFPVCSSLDNVGSAAAWPITGLPVSNAAVSCTIDARLKSPAPLELTAYCFPVVQAYSRRCAQ